MNGTEFARLLGYMAHAIESHRDLLCALDGEVGDGDHGVSMAVGMRAARHALGALPSPTPESCLAAMSDAFADEVGASSGVIYEAAFSAAARSVQGLDAMDKPEDWDRVFHAIAQAVKETGKAELGDKTMLDAWLPAAEALHRAREQGKDAAGCLTAAVDAAAEGVARTADLIPRRGRASLLGERARGHRDAGASSAYLMIRALRDGVVSPGGPNPPTATRNVFLDAPAMQRRLAPWRPSVLTWQAFAPFLAMGGSHARMLEEVASLEFFSCVELTTIEAPSERKKIRRLVQDQNWHAVVWASDAQAREELHLGSADKARRHRSRERYRTLLDEAAECGATRFGFCSPPDLPGEDRNGAIDRLAEELIDLSLEADRRGMAVIFEGLDRHAHKKGMLGTSPELDRMARRIRQSAPGFGLVWDAAHTALNGEELVESYKLIAPHVVIAHLSEAVLDKDHPDYGDRHLPFGTGSVLTRANVRDLIGRMRQEHRTDGVPLCLAIEELSTEYGLHASDLLQRAWAELKDCLG